MRAFAAVVVVIAGTALANGRNSSGPAPRPPAPPPHGISRGGGAPAHAALAPRPPPPPPPGWRPEHRHHRPPSVAYIVVPGYTGIYPSDVESPYAPEQATEVEPQSPSDTAPPTDVGPPPPYAPAIPPPPPTAAPGAPVPQRVESMGTASDIQEDNTPGPDVYHWVDANGVDNYSTEVPPEAKARAKKVNGELSGVVWKVERLNGK